MSRPRQVKFRVKGRRIEYPSFSASIIASSSFPTAAFLSMRRRWPGTSRMRFVTSSQTSFSALFLATIIATTKPSPRRQRPQSRSSQFGGEVWCYEVWSNLWPNVVVDISLVVDEKRAAINCYQSVVVHMPYEEAVLGLNRFRGFKMRIPFGEALYVCPGEAFVDLCRTLTIV